MRKITLFLLLLSLTASAQEVVNGNRYYVPGTGTATQIPNAASTGTTVNKLAKLTGTGTAVIAATTDTSGVVGVVVGGAGTSGNADIVRDGQASLVFDGATTANDYVQISSSVGGDGHDAGSTCPTTGQVVGRVLSTNGSGGTYTIIVGSSGCGGASGGVGTINAASQFSDPYYSAAGSSTTISGITAPTGPNGVPQTKVSIPSSGAATLPQFALPGVSGRAVTGTTSTDTILATDCNPYRVTYIGSVSVAVTLPTAATLAVPNCAFKVVNGTSGSSTTVTITPTTWTISAGGGSTGASLVLAQGQEATVFVDPNSATNWVADVVEQGLTAGTNVTFTRSPSGLSIATATGGSVTSVGLVGTANQILVTGTSPITSSGSWTLSVPPALSLGTDNTTAGTVQMANGAANAHTVWGSAATTNNTILGFAAAPTTGHVVTCVVSGSTCTLTDGGAPGTGTLTNINTTTPISGGPITTSGTISCPTCATGPGTSTANHYAKFSGADGLTLADGGSTLPCTAHYSPIAGSADQITAAGAFATTQSVGTSCIGVGTTITVRAHGVYTTTATSAPKGTFEVNAGGTTGICPAAAGASISITQTNGYWEVVCYIQINTTGGPGTAVAWGNQFLGNTNGSTSGLTWFFVNNSTGTVSYTTTSAQTVSIQETSTMVSGQTFNLTALDIMVAQ